MTQTYMYLPQIKLNRLTKIVEEMRGEEHNMYNPMISCPSGRCHRSNKSLIRKIL